MTPRSNLLLGGDDLTRLLDGDVRLPDACTVELTRAAEWTEALTELARRGVSVYIAVDAMQTSELPAALPAMARGVLVRAVTTSAQVARVGDWARASRPAGLVAPELIVVLEAAAGVWAAPEIAQADPAVTQLAFAEQAYIASIGAEPSVDVDPCAYAKGRVLIEAFNVGARPVLFLENSEVVTQAQLQGIADKGYKGVITDDVSLVAVADVAFSPRQEQVDYARRALDAFDAAVRAGSAAARLDGRMIDVPVAGWASQVIGVAEQMAQRDATKKHWQRVAAESCLSERSAW